MRDCLGNTLKVGDTIAYCTRRGSSMNQKPSIDEGFLTIYIIDTLK